MSRLRQHREAAGLSQGELAARAGVSRQAVGAAESGRHVPRVDAALAMAAALGVAVGELFGTSPPPLDVRSGEHPIEGDLVRLGRVRDQIVTSPVEGGLDGWDVADGIVEASMVRPFAARRPGLVVAGCEPGIRVLEGLLRQDGMEALAVMCSNAVAIGALRAGRIHAAVVHGPEHDFPSAPALDVVRIGFGRWQVGLAGPADVPDGWWRAAIEGDGAVIQREPGAAVQRTFEQATPGRRVPGPVVGTHLAAARRSALTSMPAVTIEPAAAAVGARFHPLSVHEVEFWVDRRSADDPAVTAAIQVMGSQVFRARLDAVGGYDLSRFGTRVA